MINPCPYARSTAPETPSEDRKPQAERPLLNNYGTLGVTPSLHVDYKHTTIKQYHNCDARSHAMSEYVGLEVQPMLKT